MGCGSSHAAQPVSSSVPVRGSSGASNSSSPPQKANEQTKTADSQPANSAHSSAPKEAISPKSGNKVSPSPESNQASLAASSGDEAKATAHPGHRKTPSIVNPKKLSTEEKYTVLKVLGEGASCKVVSVINRGSSQLAAMKIMDKAESYNRVLFENETMILKSMKHPNILEFIESYEDKKTYHLVTVLCQGGELFDRVKNGSFSEKAASTLTRQMLQALSFCHEKNIVHRDLKPENFVFENSLEESPMKLIDFGCAKFVLDEEIVTDVAGSPYYAAPEVLSESFVRTGKVWKASDMWSVGVIVFLLVCGYPPFNSDTQEKIFRKIKKGKYRFPAAGELGGVDLSESVKDLITKLLQMKPGDRLGAQEALKHPWVIGEAAPDTPLPAVVVEALSAFRSKCRLKKAVGRVLGHRMTEDDKASLQEVFKQFDANGDGQLGPQEISALMKHIGKSDAEAKDMLEQMDEDGDGGVSFGEFQNAAALAKLNNENEIKKSFDLFDLDHDGFVSHDEIEKVCQFLTQDQADSLIKEVDKNQDGKINFYEWLAAMTDLDAKIAHQDPNHKTKKSSAQSSPAASTPQAQAAASTPAPAAAPAPAQ